jgi:excisionase family DNA binding protein
VCEGAGSCPLLLAFRPRSALLAGHAFTHVHAPHLEVIVAKHVEGSPKPQPDRSDLIRRLEDAGLRVGRSPSLDEPLLTTSQVAAILRTSPRTVRNWADGGKIGTIRSLGGRRLFPASAVLAALETMIGSESPDRSKT